MLVGAWIQVLWRFTRMVRDFILEISEVEAFLAVAATAASVGRG